MAYVNQGEKYTYEDIESHLQQYTQIVKQKKIESPVLILYENLFQTFIMNLTLLQNEHIVIPVRKKNFEHGKNRYARSIIDLTDSSIQFMHCSKKSDLPFTASGIISVSPFDGCFNSYIDKSSFLRYKDELTNLIRGHGITSLDVSEHFGDCELLCIMLIGLINQIPIQVYSLYDNDQNCMTDALFISSMEFQYVLQEQKFLASSVWFVHGLVGDSRKYSALKQHPNVSVYTQLPWHPNGQFWIYNHKDSNGIDFPNNMFAIEKLEDTDEETGILIFPAPTYEGDEEANLPVFIRTDLVCRRTGNYFHYVKSLGSHIRYFGVDLDLNLMESLFRSIYGVRQCCFRFVYNAESIPELFCYYTSVRDIDDTLRIKQEAYRLFSGFLNQENVILLNELPLNSYRTVDREKLPDPYPLRNSRYGNICAPVVQALKQYLQIHTGKPVVMNNLEKDLMVSFDDLQINSIAFVDLVISMENDLNIHIPDTMLEISLYTDLRSFLCYLSTLYDESSR